MSEELSKRVHNGMVRISLKPTELGDQGADIFAVSDASQYLFPVVEWASEQNDPLEFFDAAANSLGVNWDMARVMGSNTREITKEELADSRVLSYLKAIGTVGLTLRVGLPRNTGGGTVMWHSPTYHRTGWKPWGGLSAVRLSQPRLETIMLATGSEGVRKHSARLAELAVSLSLDTTSGQ